jgi:hypothetical protein
MIKHVGKHNQRRVAIVYRKVPGDDHMCLVAYPDTLPSMIHDETMKCLESAVGQQAKELADALFRTTMADGENCLGTLHKKGYLKKVPCNQVIVTASKNSTCRLDQLNALIDKIDAGGEAAEELANIEKNRGIRGANPNITEGREVGQPPSLKTSSADMTGDIAPSAGVLSDADIADMHLTQAQQMEAQAKTLLAEAKRLKAEADTLKPAPAKKAPAKAKPKATATIEITAPAKVKNVRATKKTTA